MLKVEESTLGRLYLGDSDSKFHHVDSILPVAESTFSQSLQLAEQRAWRAEYNHIWSVLGPASSTLLSEPRSQSSPFLPVTKSVSAMSKEHLPTKPYRFACGVTRALLKTSQRSFLLSLQLFLGLTPSSFPTIDSSTGLSGSLTSGWAGRLTRSAGIIFSRSFSRTRNSRHKSCAHSSTRLIRHFHLF